MKIALLGYGKMGKEIEQVALQRGHNISLVIDKGNTQELNKHTLGNVDVAIEFTSPETALQNYLACFESNVPVVSGTTGWLERLPDVKKKCEEGQRFFYASNFSLGVNIFFEINKTLARLMAAHKDYKPSLEEIHHTQKLDAPSGTAITLGEDIISHIGRIKSWANTEVGATDVLPVISKREGTVPGTHTVAYDSDIDSIKITHEAKGRKGFALGAVLAAEFLQDKESGFYSMEDLLCLDIFK